MDCIIGNRQLTAGANSTATKAVMSATVNRLPRWLELPYCAKLRAVAEAFGNGVEAVEVEFSLLHCDDDAFLGISSG
jgi:hypothetical protein